METQDSDVTRNPPDIPRSAWREHPNYPSQVLLLGSHDNFRSASSALIAAAQKNADPASLLQYYRRWISGMRSHETYEERKLYPFLERRWGVSMRESQEGHQALHDAHDRVLFAFSNLRSSAPGDAGARTLLVLALKRHDEVLCEHLRVEEDAVIPLLLGLSPQEFDSYYRS